MAIVTVILLDTYGFPKDTTDVPEPLPQTIVHAEEVYLRISLRSNRYRWVSSHFSPDTPSGSFKVVKGNGDDD